MGGTGVNRKAAIIQRALVFGGSGQTGRAIAAALLDSGWQVDAATRASTLPPEVAAATLVPRAATRADTIRAGHYDAVIDTLAFTAKDAADLLAARNDSGQLVVVSTASVYADAKGRGFETGDGFPEYPNPIPEDQPTVPPGTGYSAGKVAMEQALVGADVLILRPGAIHGIGARHPREWWVLKRLLDGRRRIPLEHHAASLFHTTSAVGMAGFIAHALSRQITGTFNIADPDAPTVAQIVANVAHTACRDVEVVPLADADVAPVGHSPWSVPRPLRLNIAKALATGWDGGPAHAASMPALCGWMATHQHDWKTTFPVFATYPHDPFDYAAEDQVLARIAQNP
jgi:nucleoside-diphosphate-sugar epimerase